MSFLLKRVLPGVATGALLLAAAACADRSVAPVAPRADARPQFRPASVEGVGGSAPLTVGSSVTFTVDPTRGGTFQLANGHSIKIPANAICDLSSSYGFGTWDQSCALARQPITITATSLTNALGAPFVDFQPAMRFVPGGPRQQVVLSLYAPPQAATGTFEIDYCNDALLCLDESLTDPSLATHRKPGSPYLTRRLKHFSGYNVAVGFAQVDVDVSISY